MKSIEEYQTFLREEIKDLEETLATEDSDDMWNNGWDACAKCVIANMKIILEDKCKTCGHQLKSK